MSGKVKILARMPIISAVGAQEKPGHPYPRLLGRAGRALAGGKRQSICSVTLLVHPECIASIREITFGLPYSAFSTKSLSAPDSAPQISPLRPASCRTLA
jgi:hypothetical protein